MRHRRLMLGLGALAVIAAATVERPTAQFALITHDAADPAPRRLEAAVDLGLVGVTVLYTWTVKRLAR